MNNVYELVKNAKVEVTRVINDKHDIQALISVNDTYEHLFPYTSRISKHLEMMSPNDLAERLTGGSFFFVEDSLVDFRDGHYTGFVHSDDTISNYMDVMGYVRKNEIELKHIQKYSLINEEIGISPILLRKVWDKSQISVPGYSSMGGDFDSVLSFTWNPFVRTVNSAFDLVRIICENGLIGLTSFLNTRVPLENRFEEHLNIATKQIQNKINSIVNERVGIMAQKPASLADVLLLEEHALERLYSTVISSEHQRLTTIINAISPKVQLADIYRPTVFEDKRLAAQVPSHLTQFDVFNVATELRTYTTPTKKSTDNALDKFANAKLFDPGNDVVALQKSSNDDYAFENASKAFFGIVA
ncbi:MAG: hypothetical protein ACXW2E_01495 [Nitrososphaeraceae archaeon]